jgi:tRNA-dihydrouridine synthase B
MRIGTIQLPKYPVFLAPMEDVTDPPFRFMCKKFGVDMMYSEFVSSDALVRNVKKTLQKMEIHPEEHPFGIQLYGKNIPAMIESARITEAWKPDLLDLNFGCPVKKVAMKGAGAGLLRDVPTVIKMTREIVRSTTLPVTVKTRLGWDDENKNILELAKRLQDTGIKALCIHGRTRAQMYKGKADWNLIGEVKNNPQIHIPIIGNGDIDSPQMAKAMFDQYGVDAIMIGRASIGRPWLFREVRHYLNTGEMLPPFTVSEQVDLIIEHLNKVLETKEAKRAIISMRRFFAVSFKGLFNFRETRIRLLRAEDPDIVMSILTEIKEKWGCQPLNSVPSKEEK